MRICLLVEGCYPYVAGGVASWIQMLEKGMPETEFTIFTIGAEEKMRGVYKYDIPQNVKGISEHFLDEYAGVADFREKRVKTPAAVHRELVNIIMGNEVDWSHIFDFFHKTAAGRANDFLSSAEFMDIILEISETKYKHIPFRETYWTIRSMLIPILNLLSCEIPEADIYHSVSTGYAGIIGAMCRHFTGKPFIITEHGIYSREREEEILKADWVDSYFKQTWIDFFNAMCKGGYIFADRVVSLYNGARETEISLGAAPDKCMVIPNGTSLERFKHVPVISKEPHPLNIGAIIRVVPIKDIKTMIFSFSLVKARRPDATLYLIGPTDESEEYYEECKELIANLGVQDIIFAGRVNVADWMERLDIILLTSVSEGQPFVLLEAMAAHRPVVATNVGSCREIIEGYMDEFGHAGMVVPVMNPPGIAKGILKLAQSTETMIACAEEGYNRVKRYYQEKDFLDNYRRLYEEMITKWQASDLN